MMIFLFCKFKEISTVTSKKLHIKLIVFIKKYEYIYNVKLVLRTRNIKRFQWKYRVEKQIYFDICIYIYTYIYK